MCRANPCKTCGYHYLAETKHPYGNCDGDSIGHLGNAQRMDVDGDESKETFADKLMNGNSESSKKPRTANKAVT